MKVFSANRGWLFAVLTSLCLVGVAVGVAQRGQPVPVDQQALEQAEAISTSFRTVAKNASPSIVSIVTTTKGQTIEHAQMPFNDNSPFGQFFQNDPQLKKFFDRREFSTPQQTPQKRGMGSGFVIDESGIILTNNHVVNGADEVKVRLHDGREFLATDIKTDPRADVAIVRIKAPRVSKPFRWATAARWKSAIGSWLSAARSVWTPP